MPRQDTDIRLNLYTRHTNIMLPHSDYITPISFPEQNTKLLGKEVSIKIRNMYIGYIENKKYDHQDFPIMPVDPIGDTSTIDPFPYYTEDKFKILRCDNEEPFRMIGVSTNYDCIIVTDSRSYEEKVAIYPIQISEFIGITLRDQYPGEISEIKAVTLRVDNGEPCYSVIMEYIADGKVRFLLGDEVCSILMDYYNAPDYDGKDSKSYNDFIDINGGEVDKTVGALFYSVDGGPANTLLEIYKSTKTKQEIIQARKELLEGVEIYGID